MYIMEAMVSSRGLEEFCEDCNWMWKWPDVQECHQEDPGTKTLNLLISGYREVNLSMMEDMACFWDL